LEEVPRNLVGRECNQKEEETQCLKKENGQRGWAHASAPLKTCSSAKSVMGLEGKDRKLQGDHRVDKER